MITNKADTLDLLVLQPAGQLLIHNEIKGADKRINGHMEGVQRACKAETHGYDGSMSNGCRRRGFHERGDTNH